MPTTAPLIARFWEPVLVNGPAWKALIESSAGRVWKIVVAFNLFVC
jgi:hypothetical protein